MSTPKTTFYLTNGTKLADVYPLESNGPASVGSSGGPNLSMPNEIFDIDYTGNIITVFGDLSERFVSLIGNTFAGAVNTSSIICGTTSEFNNLIAGGMAPGMFVEIGMIGAETQSPVDKRTRIAAINKQTRTITLSAPLRSTITARTVKFCYPFNIIDLDPQTPSPYVAEYGASSCVFSDRATKITLSPQTPLVTASFDVVKVITGTSGTWIIQGLLNGAEVFYPGSVFDVVSNTFAPANTSYTVANTFQSGVYNVTDIVVNASTTTLTVKGNVGQYFIAQPAAPYQQLVITGNTTHNTGQHPLNGAHDIVAVGSYNALNDTTTVTIGEVISGVTGAANGNVAPALPTTAISVVGQIVNGTQANGVLEAGKPFESTFSAPPAITPTTPNTYIISWRIAGNHTSKFIPGHTVTIKNNNYYPFKRLTIDSAVFANSTTEIRTIITDPGATAPVIGQSGSIIYPAPPVPYGHIQYTVLTPSTSLQLVGRGVTHYNTTTTWGQALQDNAIHQLENFAANTPPPAPINGQYWFDTSKPAMFMYNNGVWNNVMIAGTQIQQDLSMNGHAIFGLANIDEQAYGPSQALNLGSADFRYVNVTGDTMTGSLAMSSKKITMVGDTDIPTGATINLSTVNGQDAINMRTGDARYVNVDGDTMLAELSMGMHRITSVANPSQSQDAATKSYVDSLTSGIVWLQPVLDPNLFDDTLSSPPSIADTTMLFYRSYFVKPVKYAIVGVNDALKQWHIAGDRSAIILPGHKLTITENTKATANGQYTVVSVTINAGTTYVTVVEAIPSLTTMSGFMYHAGGTWNNLDGRVMGWDNTNSQWVDVLERPVQVGDRFGVYFEVDNDETGVPIPGGSFAVGTPLGTATKSAAGRIVTVNAIDKDFAIDWGTAAGAALPPHTPHEPDAVSVLGVNSSHYGHSYTFRGMWASGAYSTDYKWIEFAGPSMLVDGAGLRYSGNVLNVGQGTGITVTANAVGVNATWMNTNYMRRDGLTAFTANISMGTHRLMDLVDPASPQDAVTLKYFNDYALNSSGDTMTGDLNMGGNRITNLATPTVGTDAVTKTYADLKLSKTGGTMTGPLVMSSAIGSAPIDMGSTNKIINLDDAVNAMDALNLRTADGRYVNINGDTMTGPLSLNADPTQVAHAATKRYVDAIAAATVSSVQSAAIDGGVY